MKVYNLTSIELSRQSKSLILDFKKIDNEEFIIDTRCDKAIGTPRSKNHNKLLYTIMVVNVEFKLHVKIS